MQRTRTSIVLGERDGCGAAGRPPMVYDSTIDETSFSGPFFGLSQSNCGQVFKFVNYVTQTGPGRRLRTASMRTAGPWSSSARLDPGFEGVRARRADRRARLDIQGVQSVAAHLRYRRCRRHRGARRQRLLPTASSTCPASTASCTRSISRPDSRLWDFNFNASAGVTDGGLSTPARYGNDMVFGYNGGVFDLNATTGAVVWQYSRPDRQLR